MNKPTSFLPEGQEDKNLAKCDQDILDIHKRADMEFCKWLKEKRKKAKEGATAHASRVDVLKEKVRDIYSSIEYRQREIAKAKSDIEFHLMWKENMEAEAKVYERLINAEDK